MRAAMNVDYDPAPRLPVSPGERVFVVLLAVALSALLVADLARGFSPNKLSVVFVLLFWAPLLVLHELGHALAARLVGWRVTEVVIGFGRELRRFRVGGMRVRLRAVPVEGYVLTAPGSTEWARAKQAWVYFAGPLTELLVLAALAPVLQLELPRPGDSVGRVALQSLGLTAALGALCTLFPYRSQGNPSDGLGVLTSWLASEQSFRQRLAQPFIEEARRLILREQPTLAERVIATGLEQHVDEPRLVGLSAVCRARAGDAEGAYARLEELGPPEERPPLVRAELLADAAWCVLEAHDGPLLPEAERALERALELCPGEPHYEILLGRVLLERSRPEDAYVQLMSAYKRTRDVDQEAQCIAYLALACQALSGLSGALRQAGYAPRFEAAVRSHDVPPALRERALARASAARD